LKESILVYRIGQLGDTLVSIPAISAIHEKYPEHNLVLLTEKTRSGNNIISSWDILEPTGWFDKVIFYYPATNIVAKVTTMFSVVSKLRKIRPEIVIDLSPERNKLQALRDKLFFKIMVGVRKYMAYGAYPKFNRLNNGDLPRVIPEWQRLLGIVSEDAFINFRLPIPENEQKNIDKLFSTGLIDNNVRMVAIGPGSKMPAKKWPEDYFAELGKSLLSKYSDIVLVVLGGKEDAEVGDRLCNLWGRRSFNYAGKYSIYGSYALLNKCFAYIGNDTGTMHLAAMARIPCVVIFSARDYPGKWEPYGNSNIVLRHETSCSGCMLEICSANANICTKLITVDEALSAFGKINSDCCSTHVEH